MFKQYILIIYKNGSSISLDVPENYYQEKYKNKPEKKLHKIFMNEYKSFVKALNKNEAVVIEDIDKKEEEKEQVKEKISKSKEESRNWLNIGWFMYVKGRLKKQEDVKKFAEYVSANGVKKLSKLKKGEI